MTFIDFLNSAFSAGCIPLNLLWPQKQRGWKDDMEDDEDEYIVVSYVSTYECEGTQQQVDVNAH